MEERIAGPVAQGDKAKALIRVVPLDRRPHGRAGGAVEFGAAGRRIPEIARWRPVVGIVEIAAPAGAKISVSIAHVAFLVRSINRTLRRPQAIVNLGSGPPTG